MGLLDFLGLGPRPDDAGREKTRDEAPTETIRRILRALEEMEPERARHLASFAFILSRVANADSHISDEERAKMERLVARFGNLPEEQALLVVQVAIHQNVLFGGTDNFIVTREYKRRASSREKEELLHCLFAISASDESISSIEESAIAQIARELGVDHRDLVAIRAAYREKRAVLKDLPKG